jgi:hypothetical protein
MEKIKYDKVLTTTTMFVISDLIEKAYAEKIKKQTNELKDDLSQINSFSGLKKYIQTYPNSLENLLCILDISVEKFKRIISMLRINRRYSFKSEWSLTKTRKSMIEKDELMNEVCSLLLEGASTPKYKAFLPNFYLENFKINLNVLSRLTNEDDLRRLIKTKLETSYNNEIANYYYELVMKEISHMAGLQGYDVNPKALVNEIGREASATITDKKNLRIVIDISYMITTSSSQTDYAKKVKSTYNLQKTLSTNNPKDGFIYIIIIDGAGWIGRQSDLENIYKSCNYFLNLNTIKQFSEILKEI